MSASDHNAEILVFLIDTSDTSYHCQKGHILIVRYLTDTLDTGNIVENSTQYSLEEFMLADSRHNVVINLRESIVRPNTRTYIKGKHGLSPGHYELVYNHDKIKDTKHGVRPIVYVKFESLKDAMKVIPNYRNTFNVGNIM
ncbi:hypothetical protein HDU85_005923 [Gaertneriomyces sp. JEL0708]|nr:hypothetical protein HDU85_005923 [Gaertneriomyces sp. JEL0708]